MIIHGNKWISINKNNILNFTIWIIFRVQSDTKIVIIMSRKRSVNVARSGDWLVNVLFWNFRGQTAAAHTKLIFYLYASTNCDGRRISHAKQTILWQFDFNFALRCGGHCLECLSNRSFIVWMCQTRNIWSGNSTVRHHAFQVMKLVYHELFSFLSIILILLINTMIHFYIQ